mmetsp:Transcript_5653/g.8206  ORF Transcript_5653/g.8206 Transcript_5653/m.8206 type:complete len:135 (+) Transcript_5653:75-479(+)
MRRTLTPLILFIILPLTNSWINSSFRSHIPPAVKLISLKSKSDSSEASSTTNESNCSWQDIWSYDCAMSNIYSSTFIAKDWIDSLPCANGLSDCDAPDLLDLPGTITNAGVENVDVMEYLNLKRVEPLKKNIKP